MKIAEVSAPLNPVTTHARKVPVVVLFEPAADQFSYESKFVPLVTRYFDPERFSVYIVGTSGLKSSVDQTKFVPIEMPVGDVGHRGGFRFLKYLFALALSSLYLVKAVGVSRSRILVTMAGHCYTGFVVAVIGKVMMRKTVVRISEPTRTLLRNNKRSGILYAATCWTEKLSLSLSDAVFSVRDMSDYCTVPSGRAFVIGQGIDLESITNSRPIGLADELSPLVAFVGRLDTEKAVDKLIDSIAILVPSYKTIGCLLVGWGPEASKLKRKVADESLDSHVKFVGYVPPSRVPSIIKTCDIFVLPSEAEGVPSAALEAMACRIPVVMCLQSGSFADSVKRYGAALIVLPNAEAIAKGTIAILSDSEMSNTLRDAGFEFVKRFHDDRKSRESFTRLLVSMSDPLRRRE